VDADGSYKVGLFFKGRMKPSSCCGGVVVIGKKHTMVIAAVILASRGVQ
jgi:hypothetical protein